MSNTSQDNTVLSEVFSDDEISSGTLAYFSARLRNRIYNYILTRFIEEETAGNITKAQLARRIGKQPAVITRMLNSPGNWRIDTISDLLLGIAREEACISSEKIETAAQGVEESTFVTVSHGATTGSYIFWSPNLPLEGVSALGTTATTASPAYLDAYNNLDDIDCDEPIKQVQ